MSPVEMDGEGWVIKMSAVQKIKANRHAPQRNDTAIKLYIKVVCVIYFVIIYTFILEREWNSGSNVFTVTDMVSLKICICPKDTQCTTIIKKEFR